MSDVDWDLIVKKQDKRITEDIKDFVKQVPKWLWEKGHTRANPQDFPLVFLDSD